MQTETFTTQMTKRSHTEYTVDVMTLFVNGKQVGQADVVNLHETFAERMSQVRRTLIAEYDRSTTVKF